MGVLSAAVTVGALGGFAAVGRAVSAAGGLSSLALGGAFGGGAGFGGFGAFLSVVARLRISTFSPSFSRYKCSPSRAGVMCMLSSARVVPCP